MDESDKPSSPQQDVEAATLRRTPTESAPTAVDAFAATLGPNPKTPSQGGVALDVSRVNLPQVARERYLLEGIVAEGGHGRILRAQDLHLERVVALKEPISPTTSPEERFLREARITARLQHPSIVPVYEAGRFPGGEPFYAMKLVSGRSLARVIESMGSLDERLAALPHVLAVAEAMAYAHSQRVIHRDLKPSNILVGEFGETVVIDWGLAKELDQPEVPLLASGATSPASADPERTQLGTILGTPGYMPPEQASGQPVDERADVYALGALLYHLLSGQAPYVGTDPQEVLQRVLSQEPTSLAKLQPRLTQELLDIVSRAMARDPAQRYPSARELAEDLRRFQRGQLVNAHRYTASERVLRFVRRHRAALLVGALAVAALLVKEARDHDRILQERDRAEKERDRAEAKQLAAERAEKEARERADSLTVMEARSAVAQSPERVLPLLESLSPGFQEWGSARTLAAAALAQGVPTTLRGHGGAINLAGFSADGLHVFTVSDDRTLRRWDVQTGKAQVLETFNDEAWRFALSPDERYVASSSKDGQVRLLELATGTSRLLLGHTGSVGCLQFSTDGRFLYSADSHGELRKWEVASGAGHIIGKHEGEVVALGVLSDGRHLLSAGTQDLTARLWDVEDGTRQLIVSGTLSLTMVAASQKSSAFAVATNRGKVLLWESAEQLPRELEGGRGSIQALRFSPDGSRLAALSSEGQTLLWELPGGELRTFESAPGWWDSIAFSPDGRWLASGGRDGKARMWELATGQSRVLHGATVTLSAVAFSPDGKRLITASHDGAARIHEVEERSTRVVAKLEGELPKEIVPREMRYNVLAEILGMVPDKVLALVPTPDGRHVLSVDGLEGRLHRSSLEESADEVREAPGALTAASALPDGSRLVTGGKDGTVVLWDEQGQQLQRFAGPTDRVLALRFSADGRQVAAGDGAGTVWLWDTVSGQGRALGQHEGFVGAVAFSPDGRQLASGGKDGAVRLWELASGKDRVVHRHAQDVSDLSFSPDGEILASGSQDHTVWVEWLQRDAGSTPNEASGHSLDMGAVGVQLLRFTPDGRELLISSAGEPRVRRWDLQKRQFLTSYLGHTHHALDLAFSPEGQRMVTASSDGTVRVWDRQSGESRVLKEHRGPVLHVAFSRDGRSVLSAGQDGTVRVWRDDLPLDPQDLRAWIRDQARK
ncbi:protein kinase domain-containing protein [Hyalangium minutum]|uniref:Putative serine/threonine-protein kinase pkwA n=1 Tax=Hyalangium minutum TaxID=394096 RepID=A0A085WEH3_9BACT|nr:serine/threonine-protein kinase [Hyalangium minutum]KFE66086.1 putative serine/threonine-protein kinase pkwA [Hyalangium minutum]